MAVFTHVVTDKVAELRTCPRQFDDIRSGVEVALKAAPSKGSPFYTDLIETPAFGGVRIEMRNDGVFEYLVHCGAKSIGAGMLGFALRSTGDLVIWTEVGRGPIRDTTGILPRKLIAAVHQALGIQGSAPELTGESISGGTA